MIFNFNKIIIEDLRKIFTEEELTKLKEEGSKIRTYLVNVDTSRFAKYTKCSRDFTIQQNMEEIIYCRSAYMKYNDYEKSYILMNSVFPDSRNFIQTIFYSDTASEYCLDYEILSIYLRCLAKLKTMDEQKIDKNNMNKTEEKIYKYCLYYSKILKKIFNKKMGPVSIEIIINKLYQVFTTEKELIEEVTGQYYKTKIKK